MLDRPKHIIQSFDAALYGLRNDVLMMSSLTDRMIQTAFEALQSRSNELCDQVIAEDDEIDALEKQVDEEGLCAASISSSGLRYERGDFCVEGQHESRTNRRPIR